MASGRIDTPERLIETVKSFMLSNKLVGDNSLVLAAVSGGADSMAMLSILHALGAPLGFRVAAGHFNHGLRDRNEAENERGLVEDTAASLGIPFYYGEGDAGADAATTGDSLEETARRVRYEFLDGLAIRIGADHIATGHTRSDQAETVLMRMLRGAGIRGLAGIPVQRDGGRIIRPLLGIDRDQTRHYCATTGVRFADDPSNEDRRFLRNRIRLDLLPLLESGYDPAVAANLIRLSENAAALLKTIRNRTGPLMDESLTQEGDGTWVVDLEAAGFGTPAAEHPHAGQPVTGQRVTHEPGPGAGDMTTGSDERSVDATALIVFLGDLFTDKIGCDSDLTRAHYEQLIRLATDPLASGKKISLPGYTVKKEYQTLRITRGYPRAETTGVPKLPDRAAWEPVTVALPGRTNVPGLQVTTEILERLDIPDEFLKSFDKEAYFDLQQIEPPLTLRTPSPGDRMQLFGMSGTKKLSDIFIDKKIPASRRCETPVLTDSEHIIWIVGVASSETTRVDEKTQEVIRVTVEKT